MAWLAAPSRPLAWGGLVVVAAVAIQLNANFVLNYFYQDGAGIDAWWFAAMMWRGQLSLPIPEAILGVPRSFYGVHLSPILAVPALLSHFVPVGRVAWFALWIGVIHASLAVAFYRLLMRDYGLATRGGVFIAAALSLGYGFGGIAMAALQLPHYEFLIVSFGLFFLAAVARAAHREAWLWLAAAMLVREDAGFHLFAVLFLAQVLRRKPGVWRFAAATFGASVAAMALQRVAWFDETVLTRNYIGDPPFAHLTRDAIFERLNIVLNLRAYVWIPFVVALLWALIQRNAMIALAFVAALPWIALHLIGTTQVNGTIDVYYPFPVLLAIAWPLIGFVWQGGTPIAGGLRWRALAGQTVLIVAGLVGWMADRIVVYPLQMNLAITDGTREADRIEAFRVRLANALRTLGAVRGDYGTIGFLPHAFRPADWLNPRALEGADTVIWFDPGQQDSLAWGTWLSSRLANHYQVLGSNILLASNRRLEQSPALAPALVPANPVWRRMRPTWIAERTSEGFRVARDRPASLIAEGPHSWWRYGLYFAHGVTVPAGRYEARFDFSFASARDPFIELARLEVGFAWGPTVAQATVRADQLRPETVTGQQPVRITLPFVVDQQNAARFLQLRAFHVGNADVTLRNITLVRAAD